MIITVLAVGLAVLLILTGGWFAFLALHPTAVPSERLAMAAGCLGCAALAVVLLATVIR